MFRTFGWINPRALAEEILDLKKCDVIVTSAGANDVYRNNKALMNIIKFIQNNGNTNIMILGVPHRHDLVEYSCVNEQFRYLIIS
jgi:hypothetical protein